MTKQKLSPKPLRRKLKGIFMIHSLIALLLGPLILTRTVLATPCPISQSIYRDANGEDFELIFGPAIPGGTADATAMVSHLKQEELYRFEVSQSSGYGRISLIDVAPKLPTSEDFVWPTLFFFDETLGSDTPLFFEEASEASEYAFIANLGIYDHYSRRDTLTEDTPPLLGDVMWVYDRCQTNHSIEP